MFARMVALSLLALGCKKNEPVAATENRPIHAPIKAPMLPAVNFESGSAEILPSEEGAIDRAAEILEDSDWKLVVVGLADATGDASANRELSQERADAVAARLRQKISTPPNRIQTVAVGERLASGGSAAKERKVEFVFYHDEGLPLQEVVARSRVLEPEFDAHR